MAAAREERKEMEENQREEHKIDQLQNRTFLVNGHGANLGYFFKLPENTRVFLPSLNIQTYANLKTEIEIMKILLTRVDQTCSNIDKYLQGFIEENRKHNQDLNFTYKIYNNYCPEISYSEEEEFRWMSGILECPIKLKQVYLRAHESQSQGGQPIFRQAGETINIDNPMKLLIKYETDFVEKYESFASTYKQTMIGFLSTVPNARNPIIAHILFPQSKLSQAYTKLPDYVTFIDTNDHLPFNKYKANSGNKDIHLSELITYYRAKIDPNITLTIISVVCNNLPANMTEQDIKNYNKLNENHGINYDEYKTDINFRGLTDSGPLLSSHHIDAQDAALTDIDTSNIILEAFIGTFVDKIKEGQEPPAAYTAALELFKWKNPYGDLKLVYIPILSNKLTDMINQVRTGNDSNKDSILENYTILNSLIDIRKQKAAEGVAAGAYEKKYLKYKNKYLALKNLI